MPSGVALRQTDWDRFWLSLRRCRKVQSWRTKGATLRGPPHLIDCTLQKFSARASVFVPREIKLVSCALDPGQRAKIDNRIVSGAVSVRMKRYCRIDDPMRSALASSPTYVVEFLPLSTDDVVAGSNQKVKGCVAARGSSCAFRNILAGSVK